MSAGLERRIDRGSVRFFAGLTQGHGLAVWPSAERSRSAPDDLARRRDDYAADIGIGRTLPPRVIGERERLLHALAVVTQSRAASRASGTGAAFPSLPPAWPPGPSSARR